MTIERGIVASPGVIERIQDGFSIKRIIALEELYYYILYWHRVVIPGNNLVNIGVPNERELIECGAIERPLVQHRGTFFGDMLGNAIMSAQSTVAEELMKDKSVDWVIHQLGGDVVLKPEHSIVQDQIRFDLSNALPVPSPDTPLHEILEFRDRRKDALNELHALLDEVYLSILSSPDPDLQKRTEISRLAAMIGDLERLSSASFKKSKKYDISVSINTSFDRIAGGAMVGALAGAVQPEVAFVLGTAIAAGVAAMVKVEAKATYCFEPAKERLKLSYLADASSAGILQAPGDRRR